MRVLTGHCVEMSGAPPYLPYVEIIEQAISNPRSPRCGRRFGDVAAEIAAYRAGAAAGIPGHPAARRAAARAGAPLCVEQPRRVHGPRRGGHAVALVLEDLHWADESTVLLTEYLAPLLPEMPVLVLGTYRDIEVDLDHPLARVISASWRAGTW